MILAVSKKLRLTLLSLTLIISLNSCADKTQIKEHIIQGPTMGTQYKLVIKSNESVDLDMISNGVDSILIDIDNQMSTYNPKSEISNFNKSSFRRKEEGVYVSPHFYNVLEKSIYYHELSNGMFDIRIQSLYELWGFQNKDGNLIAEPTKEEIEELLVQGNVGLKDGKLLSKATIVGSSMSISLPKIKDDIRTMGTGGEQTPMDGREPILRAEYIYDLSIDVSAIAKGYAVDVISDYIENQGYLNYFIDIGGEIKVSSTIDRYWDIGIQEPSPERLGNAIEMVRLSNNSIATSGNYANFIKYINSDAKRTHIINPKTGYPLEIKDGMIASVSIVAPLCVDADALATTLMLLSKEEGLKLIESVKDTEAYIIYFEDDRLYTEQSSGFKKYIYK